MHINNIFLEEGELADDEDNNIISSRNQIVIPLTGQIRRREESEIFEPNKSFRSNSGKRIIRERTQLYSSLKLKSGEEFLFSEVLKLY
jgi:hypothetical protein